MNSKIRISHIFILFLLLFSVSGYSTEPGIDLSIIPIPLTPEVADMIDNITADPVERLYYQEIMFHKLHYLNYFKKIFKIYGLPPELVYISIVESGVNPNARSSMNALGVWQFMAPTARELGLKVNYWIDERSDYSKSTHAAARYLKDLYILFNNWEFAIASYNVGSSKFRRALRTSESPVNLQKMNLPRETKEFVLKFYAVVHIFEHPSNYGFKFPEKKESSWQYQELYCNSIIDLKFLSRLTGTSIQEIRALNPHLKFRFTPPHEFYLKLPAGSLKNYFSGLELLGVSEEYFSPDYSIIHLETLRQYYYACPVRIRGICSSLVWGKRFYRNDQFVIIPLIDYLPDPVKDELEINYNDIHDSGYRIIEIVEEKKHLEDFRNLLELFAN